MNDGLSTPTERQQELFFAALDLPSDAARAEFLALHCADDPALRRWLEEELRRQTARTPFGGPGFDDAGHPPSAEAEALAQALKPEEAGDHVGPYRLIEPLGEGGFGAVWVAEQEQPVQRQVALKIIRLGMNSREVIARFAQERQALAVMDHPGIAKVFDAGATPFGRPYFAMELVRGVPITDFCDDYSLSLRLRLEMFRQVCSAVHHAHQKGIIHRDLKPSNVLVTLDEDGAAAPKVIDFGIAKATERQPLTELTLATQHGLLLGTPLYMSPEQAAMKTLDIDTRSDIYSLGVLLYVLVTGRTPLDRDRLDACTLDEMSRIIREEPLPRPTACLRALPVAELEAIATHRAMNAAALARSVRGDLEWICMKMLEKDRRRRYASVNAVAADVQHLLLDEPIMARPPSGRYWLNKFIERHRRGLVAVSAVLAVVFLGTISSIKEALRAEGVERRAVALEHTESTESTHANEERARAERESASAQRSAYIADVNLAQQSLLLGNLGRALELLEKHIPATGQPDLRGFGWRYLWARCHGAADGSFPDLDCPAAALAYSPDGALLAVGGLDEVRVYDARTRAGITILEPGAGSLGFLPDGKTLVTAGGGKLRLWGTADWKEQTSWDEGPGPLALSRDGSRLAVACADGVRVRDTAGWKEVRFLPGATAPLAFAPDGRTLATDAPEGVTLWRFDEARGRVLANSRGLFTGEEFTFFRPIQALAFSPDGNTVAAPQNWLSERGVFLLRFWDAHTGRETATLPGQPERPEHTGLIASLAYSPDGRLLATTSLDHAVRLWDVARGVCTDTLQGHQAEVGGCAFSPDGRALVSGDRLGRVNVWTIPRPKREEALVGVVRPLGFSRDGSLLAALTAEGAVVFYDVATNAPRRQFPLDAAASGSLPAVAVSADLGRMVQDAGGGRVRIFDPATGNGRTEYVSARDVDFLALTPDGQVLISGAGGQFLRSRDLRTGREYNLPFEARRVQLSPDSRTMALLSEEQAGGGKTPEGLLAAGRDPDNGGLRSLPSTRLIGPVAGTDGLPLWDLAANRLRTRLGVPARFVLNGAFSADGRQFATALSDNTVQVWDTANGQRAAVLTGHKQVVLAVAFSSDGKTIATASEDGTLRLWDTAAQQEILSLPVLGWHVSELLFSPDGRVLVAAVRARGQPPQLRFYRAPLLADIDREPVK